MLTIRMQFSAIRSWNLARAAEGGSLLFCAKALALDDPRARPGGQLRAGTGQSNVILWKK